MDEYRILQTADSTFVVEKAYHYTVRYWPWSAPVSKVKWVVGAGLPDYPMPFMSEAAAQKWVDDKRKYPIVVKHPA